MHANTDTAASLTPEDCETMRYVIGACPGFTAARAILGNGECQAVYDWAMAFASDCEWGEGFGALDLAELKPARLVQCAARHYDGGMAAMVTDALRELETRDDSYRSGIGLVCGHGCHPADCPHSDAEVIAAVDSHGATRRIVPGTDHPRDGWTYTSGALAAVPGTKPTASERIRANRAKLTESQRAARDAAVKLYGPSFDLADKPATLRIISDIQHANGRELVRECGEGLTLGDAGHARRMARVASSRGSRAYWLGVARELRTRR